MLKNSADSEAYADRGRFSRWCLCSSCFCWFRAPYWDSDVRGAVFGLTRGTYERAFYSCYLESLAYQTKDVLAAMEADSGIKLKTLRVDGGAVKNDFLMEFQSDLLNVPLNVQ